MRKLMQAELYISYSQFMVWDRSVALPGLAWTERHSAQGFARRESVVNFTTLIPDGMADLTVFESEFRLEAKYSRVITVPFYSPAGLVYVEGPEESGVDRAFPITPGRYCLYAAQYFHTISEDYQRLQINLYVSPPLSEAFSRIVVADDSLRLDEPLLEIAGVMEA